MELPTEHIIIIFWAMALNSVYNFRQYLIDSREKISKIPSYFSKSVGNCALEHARIGFAASVGKF
jgi:hypothetical protein